MRIATTALPRGSNAVPRLRSRGESLGKDALVPALGRCSHPGSASACRLPRHLVGRFGAGGRPRGRHLSASARPRTRTCHGGLRCGLRSVVAHEWRRVVLGVQQVRDPPVPSHRPVTAGALPVPARPRPAIGFVLLLLPSIPVTLASLDGFSEVRRALSFYLAGPLCLAASIARILARSAIALRSSSRAPVDGLSHHRHCQHRFASDTDRRGHHLHRRVQLRHQRPLRSEIRSRESSALERWRSSWSRC